MLNFNPHLRPSAKELLRHKIFDNHRNLNIRDPALEKGSSHKIRIEQDSNELKRDYTLLEQLEYCKEELADSSKADDSTL